MYLPTPFARLGCDTRSISKRSLTGLNSEFSFSKTGCLTKAKEPGLLDYLPIARGRIIGFIPFPRVLVLCEMQSASSKIWTRFVVSISYDDNHYTTGTFNTCMNIYTHMCLYVCVCMCMCVISISSLIHEVEKKNKKNQAQGHRKIPITLLSVFQPLSRLVSNQEDVKRYSWVDEGISKSYSITNVYRGEALMAPKFKLFLVRCRSLTDCLTPLKNPSVWSFIILIVRVPVIELLLSVTQPGPRFTGCEKQLLHYILLYCLYFEVSYCLQCSDMQRM